MRLLNVHNVAAHYRSPLFRELGRRFEQKVVFFQGKKSWREEKNPEDLKGYDVSEGLLRNLFFGAYDLLLMTFDGKAAPLLALLAARLRGKPCVLWHGLWDPPRTLLWRLAGPWLGLFFRSWDAILTYGAHTRRTLVAQGVPEAMIFLAPQTVDNKIYSRRVSAARIRALRKSWGLGKAKAALFVGRLVSDKGLEYLAEAVRMNRGRWKLVGVGEGPLKPLLGISLGHLKAAELAEVYAAADCLVLPSVTTKNFREPWGLVVNEAMNQGLPVIATSAVGAAAGGLAEHEVTALVVPEKDSAELSQALARLASEKGLASRLGKNGRKRIRLWTYKAMADSFEAAFAYARHAVV